MGKATPVSEVITIRVSRELGRRLSREARRRWRTVSAVARDLLVESLAKTATDETAAEARRQSLRVRRRRSERDALALVTELADLRGWE